MSEINNTSDTTTNKNNPKVIDMGPRETASISNEESSSHNNAKKGLTLDIARKEWFYLCWNCVEKTVVINNMEGGLTGGMSLG
jgi:hypothetical protein